MTHDETVFRVVGSYFVQHQRVAVLELGVDVGGHSHVNRHRLVIAGCKRVERLKNRIIEPNWVVAGIELQTAAVLPLQIRLNQPGHIPAIFT